ncbi:FtsX-like permease family protein [Streptomyces sp. WMMC500]|uniref:ABC transporter permease n=1 Tax=Streptomyces sp. WMMC500 TaxID=3015154 RepID=UPI00248B2ABF|nr:ABC transporter permease [Streptomyces sp. WMMC500]WBB60881.1 FtsX-like permease family protein [Streptomyces sp. WMMC500]
MLKATLRSFFAHKGRMLLSALAVVLSVAFVSGSLIFSDTVSRTFDRLFASTAADVAVSPKEAFDQGRGFGSGLVPTLPASVAGDVAKVPGVQDVHLDVEVENLTVTDAENEPIGRTTGPPTIASNWYVSDRSPVELSEGREPAGAGEALLDKDTADRKNVEIGDTLNVLAQPGTFEVEVVGIAKFTTTNPGAAVIYLETAAAQRQLLDDPELKGTEAATSVSVDAAPGVSDAELKKRVKGVLDGKYTVQTADEQAKSAAEELGTFLDIIKYVMLGFAGIAVLVGIFLIVNTFSMLIAQRTRELGLMRALGADRRQVRRSVLTEALLLGLVGSTLGLLSGIGLAAGLIETMGLLGMNLDAAEMVVSWVTPVFAYAVGVGVTFVAAYLPARRAARVSPMAALADLEITEVGRPMRVRAALGSVLGVVGAASFVLCATADQTRDSAVYLVGGVVLTMLAVVAAGPLLVRPVIRVLGGWFPRFFGSVGALSQRNALRNPRRTGATAVALMVGLALVGGMSVAAASMTKSFDEEIDRTLGADFLVQSDNFGPFPREVTERVHEADGVGLVVRQRFAPLRVTLPDGEKTSTSAGAFDKELDQVSRLEYAEGSTSAALAPGHVGLQRQFARDHGIRVGSTLPVEFSNGRKAELTVGALTKQETSGGFGAAGGFFLGMETLEDYQPGGQEAVVFVNAESGTDVDTLRSSLESGLEGFPQVKVRDQADFKELIREQIIVLLYLVFALLGLAIVIAVLGVVNTLALSVVERTREIGMLRAIGLSRRQTRRMIRLESVVIAVFGALLGLVLGLAWGAGVHEVLALEGMRAFAIDWTVQLAVVIGSVLVGLLAALLPALRASRLNVLAAIAHE